MCDITQHKHIIFCGDGINALGLIRGLGENGIKSILIEEKGCEGLARHSKYVQKRIQSNSWEDAFDILLQKFSNEIEKPFLYCCDDGAAAFLDSRYDLISNNFYFDNAGYQGAICHLQQKDIQLSIAKSVGFHVPNTEIVLRGKTPQHLNYPVFTKTLDSLTPGWKSEYRIIEDEKHFIQEWPSIKSDRLFVQEFIDKKNEIELHGYSSNGEIFLCLEKNYIHLPKNGFGSYMLYKRCKRDDLINMCYSLIKQINYEGLFDIEFIEDRFGKLWFCEFNMRSVMTSYCHMGAGICCPYLWAKSTLKEELINPKPTKESFLAINEISDFCSSVIHNKENFFKWLYLFFSADIHLSWNSKDPLPFFIEFFQKLKRTINHKIKWMS